MSSSLYVEIQETTNGNYRCAVARAIGSTMTREPLRIHPLLAGLQTIENVFSRIVVLYPELDCPRPENIAGHLIESLYQEIKRSGKAGILFNPRNNKPTDRPTVFSEINGMNSVSELMRLIDAYAFDYRTEGKLAVTRKQIQDELEDMFVEKRVCL